MCRGGGSRAQGLVRAGVVPTTPRSLERVRREMSHLLVVLCIFWLCCADQAIFVRFLFEVCWLLSFFSPEVPVQGELVRARGFRSRALNSALARLAGCRARGGLPTRAPRPGDSRQVSRFVVAPLSWLCV